MEGAKLVVTKLTDGDFLRKLENAIQVKNTNISIIQKNIYGLVCHVLKYPCKNYIKIWL
jgi:hypothetical protein